MNFFSRLFNNLQADILYLSCGDITIFERAFFIINKYFSILLNKRNIKYFGYNFEYDTRIAPLILQFYPCEISLLHKYINFNKVNTVLDVGANIGQTGFTMKALFPHIKIFSFEPNRLPFLKLNKNSSYFSNWKVYNYAIGKKNQSKTLYFTEDSTIGGSFIKEIAGEFLKKGKTKKIKVSVVNLNKKIIKKLSLPTKFDLVKIDVEGSELEVLASLNRIDFRYLIIEVPIKSQREVSTGKIDQVISKKLKKKAKLLHIEPVGNLGIVANAIYQLKDS